jgi:subtilase family serine protease
VCLNVFNSGTAWAGSFRVTGGGLVVRTPPQATVSSLAPGSYQAVCLYYSSAPAPGTWRVGIAVDSGGSVTESNESNNGLTVTVNVVP